MLIKKMKNRVLKKLMIKYVKKNIHLNGFVQFMVKDVKSAKKQIIYVDIYVKLVISSIAKVVLNRLLEVTFAQIIIKWNSRNK